MLRTHWQSRLDQARFHGTLAAGTERWEVYFVEVARAADYWVVECVVVGPRTLHVTIRCRSEVNHYQTAHRVMTALRNWLAAGEFRDSAYLDVPDVFEKAS